VSYRIVQWGTGNVGRHALRTIVERPDFELVGVRVYNPEKVGQDAGALLGIDPVGVVATDDTEAILALDADCVCYTSLGTTLASYDQPLDDICRLLASGKNVVSSAVEYYAYFAPGIAPNRTGDAQEHITAACAAGGTSFYHVGINPGFAMDLWPITLSRVSRRIDRITAVELVDMQQYTSPQIVRDYIGFGLAPDVVTPFDHQMAEVRESAFYLSLRMIADALHLELDDVRYHREVALAEESFSIASGVIEHGTVAAMNIHVDGLRDGEVLIALEWVWRVSDDVAPEWPPTRAGGWSRSRATRASSPSSCSPPTRTRAGPRRSPSRRSRSTRCRWSARRRPVRSTTSRSRHTAAATSARPAAHRRVFGATRPVLRPGATTATCAGCGSNPTRRAAARA
jgi:hypothetical protein